MSTVTTTGFDPSAPAVNPGFWKPVRQAPPSLDPAVLAAEPGGGAHLLYLRSYLLLRLVIGLLGAALPLVLVVGDALLPGGAILPRGSLSAYYHSGVRDVFVGVLVVVGVFLITYKVLERNLDNTLSTVAGVAAVLVAIFPTGRPSSSTSPPTPFQEFLGEPTVEGVHYVSAFVFIASLAVISYYFGVREGDRPARPGRRSPRFWRSFHHACAGAIVAAIAYIGLTKLGVLLDLVDEDGRADRYSLLIGEFVAVLAFGVSWLAKGLELPLHLGLRRVPPSSDRTPSTVTGTAGPTASDR